jgi:FkbM family methyltransferase
MLINLKELIKLYDLKINGILHIGAHKLQEKPIYESIGLKAKDVIWVEADPKTVGECRMMYPQQNIHQEVMFSRDNEEKTFFIANDTQCSSLYDLKHHKNFNPGIKMTGKCTVKTKTVKTLFQENGYEAKKYNFFNLDTQGAEWDILAGCGSLLNNVDYIYAEVNTKEVYSGIHLVQDIDKLLESYGFKKAVESLYGWEGWGDALYIKNWKGSTKTTKPYASLVQ